MNLDSDPVEFFSQGSDNLFRIARNVAKIESRRAARREGADALDPEININVDLDRRLTDLATQIIRERPMLYLNWIRHSFLYGMRQLFDDAWILVPSVLLVLSLPIAWFRRPARQEVPADSSVSVSGRRRQDLCPIQRRQLGCNAVVEVILHRRRRDGKEIPRPPPWRRAKRRSAGYGSPAPNASAQE